MLLLFRLANCPHPEIVAYARRILAGLPSDAVAIARFATLGERDDYDNGDGAGGSGGAAALAAGLGLERCGLYDRVYLLSVLRSMLMPASLTVFSQVCRIDGVVSCARPNVFARHSPRWALWRTWRISSNRWNLVYKSIVVDILYHFFSRCRKLSKTTWS